jgi:hypothetical protein
MAAYWWALRFRCPQQGPQRGEEDAGDLGVEDSNPRARSLYEKLGYDAPHRRRMAAVPRPLRAPQGRHRNLRPGIRNPLPPSTGIRCPMLRPDPAQRQRLRDIRASLTARITEAEREGWLRESLTSKTATSPHGCPEHLRDKSAGGPRAPPARQASRSPGPPPWPSPHPPFPGRPAPGNTPGSGRTQGHARSAQPRTSSRRNGLRADLVRRSSVVAAPVRGRP